MARKACLNRYHRVGPGGMNCPCCGYPSAGKRGKHYKVANRRMHLDLIKVERADLKSISLEGGKSYRI